MSMKNSLQTMVWQLLLTGKEWWTWLEERMRKSLLYLPCKQECRLVQ